MSIDTYQTIAKPSIGLFKEKGSKFLSFAYPVKSEEEIKGILLNIRKEHFSARHCCYAWSIGIQNQRFRINDDGEPSGTAGRPIYGQIQSNKLTNVLIVVVRYFGGTLLGVSGLIQAYKKAAMDAISNSEVINQTIEYLFQIHFDYGVMNELMHIIKEEQLEIVKSQFDLQCFISFKVRSAKRKDMEAQFGKLSGINSMEIIQD